MGRKERYRGRKKGAKEEEIERRNRIKLKDKEGRRKKREIAERK